MPIESCEKVWQRFYPSTTVVIQLHGGGVSLEDNAPGLRVVIFLLRS